MAESRSEAVRHTPGPWRWGSQHEDPKRFLPGNMPALIGADGTIICDFGDNEPYYPIAGLPPNEMDSALISAAPDMYEVLKWLYERPAIRNNAGIEVIITPDDAVRVRERIEAALAKAEGREASANG